MNRAGVSTKGDRQKERDKNGTGRQRSSRKGILHVPDLAHEFLSEVHDVDFG